MLRLAACWNFAVDVVEPCGFLWDERRMRRAGMDYLDRVQVTRHASWTAFDSSRRGEGRRLVLLTTKGGTPLTRFSFGAEDVIMVGRESAGVPDDVAAAADALVRIPMVPGARSLNVALAASVAMWEALRGSGCLPEEGSP